MAKNKAAEANRNFATNFQKALSTATNGQWVVLGHPQKGDLVQLYTLHTPLRLITRDNKRSYKLLARMITEVIDHPESTRKRVHTRQYGYTFSDANGKPLFDFHWHPEKIDRGALEPRPLEAGEKEPFPDPHIHVRAKDQRFDDLHKKHIPTGRIAFEDVLEFLFRDCKVRPARDDWKEVFVETKKLFDANKSWSTIAPTVKTAITKQLTNKHRNP